MDSEDQKTTKVFFDVRWNYSLDEQQIGMEKCQRQDTNKKLTA